MFAATDHNSAPLRYTDEQIAQLPILAGGVYTCIPVPCPQYERDSDIPATRRDLTFEFSREEQSRPEHLEMFRGLPVSGEHEYDVKLDGLGKRLGHVERVIIGVVNYAYIDKATGDTRAVFSLIDYPEQPDADEETKTKIEVNRTFVRFVKSYIDSGYYRDVSLTHTNGVLELPRLASNTGGSGNIVVTPKNAIELTLTSRGARPGSRIILTEEQAANGVRIKESIETDEKNAENRRRCPLDSSTDDDDDDDDNDDSFDTDTDMDLFPGSDNWSDGGGDGDGSTDCADNDDAMDIW